MSALQARTSFCNPIPDITSCYSTDEILSVQHVPAERKRLLRAYKHYFVRSVLQAYDDAYVMSCSSDTLLPFTFFRIGFFELPLWVVQLDLDFYTWRSFPAWCINDALER